MPCAFNVMSAYMSTMNASSVNCIRTDMNIKSKHVRAKTVSPPKARMDTPVPKPKVTPDKAKNKDKSAVKIDLSMIM